MTARVSDIDVLDCRHPIEWTLQSAIWQDAVRNWDGRPAFVLEEVARATEQDTLRKTFRERRYVQPLDETSPWQMPDDWYKPAPYPELTEPELAHEFETAPHTTVLDGE